MKNLFLTILLISCAYLPSRAQDTTSKEPKIKVIVEKVGWHMVWHYHQDSTKCLKVKVILANRTIDTAFFYNCSCSYHDAFITNENTKIDGWGCDGNSCGYRHLTPVNTTGSTIEYNIEIIPKVTKTNTFKIGFTWYKQKDKSINSLNFRFLDEPDEIIWSNEVSFN